MIVYTNLFTIAGKDPKENRYIDMLYIWLTYLIKNGGLSNNDKIQVRIDQSSVNYLNEHGLIGLLMRHAKCQIEFIFMDQPANASEGMIWKYSTKPELQLRTTTQPYLYIDLDVLVMKPLSNNIPDLEPGQIMVIPEGNMAHPLYVGDLLEKELTENMCGFTAGCFAFFNSDGIERFFENVSKECLENVGAQRYTVEQPFFNKWLCLTIQRQALPLSIVVNNLDIMENNKFNVTIINGIYNKETCVFLNYAGEPGNGSIHYLKMLAMLCDDFIS